MRKINILVLALAVAACSGSGGSDPAAERGAPALLPDATDPAATLRLAAGEDGDGCEYRWNGDVVTREELARRSRETMASAVSIANGIDHMTADQIPYLKLEVAPDLAFSCVEPVTTIVRDIGYPRIGLKPAMTAPVAHFVHFPLTRVGARPAAVTVAVAEGGGMTWNGEAVDLAGLAARARPMADAAAEPGAPGQLVIVPAGDASFSSIYEAVRVIRENYVETDLGRPST